MPWLSTTDDASSEQLCGMQVFTRERLNGYYGVSQFVMANTLAAVPFIFLIAVLSSVTVYWLAGLNPSGGSVIYFILDLFLSLMVVSMTISMLSMHDTADACAAQWRACF